MMISFSKISPLGIGIISPGELKCLSAKALLKLRESTVRSISALDRLHHTNLTATKLLVLLPQILESEVAKFC